MLRVCADVHLRGGKFHAEDWVAQKTLEDGVNAGPAGNVVAQVLVVGC